MHESFTWNKTNFRAPWNNEGSCNQKLSGFRWFYQPCWSQTRMHSPGIRTLTWLLFTETCLWAIQTHEILNGWSFRFTPGEGGKSSERGRQADGHNQHSGRKKKRLTTEGLRGNKTSGTLGGGHMSRDGGRGNGKVVDEYLLLKRKRVYRQLRIDWLITFCWNASEVTFSPSLV